MKNIRLIVNQPQPGAMNMAIDETLMLGLLKNSPEKTGFLRFYQWSPPTLSFGYNQRIERLVDLEKLNGIGIVRRMSGGKMVFHNDEWTFSLGIPQTSLKHEKNATFLQMFMNAVNPLVSALVAAGVPARFSDSRELKSVSGNLVHCYAAAAGHSIYAGSEKLIGAAGIVKEDCMIIHGSIPISIGFPPANIFLGEQKIDHGVSMTCLNNFLTPNQITSLPELVAEKFSQEFECPVIKNELSAEEEATARNIEWQKYADLNWKEKPQRVFSEK